MRHEFYSWLNNIQYFLLAWCRIQFWMKVWEIMLSITKLCGRNLRIFQNISNFVWKIKKTTKENHRILNFQLTFVLLFISTLLHVHFQTKTTMKFQQNINYFSTMIKIWEFLMWWFNISKELEWRSVFGRRLARDP